MSRHLLGKVLPLLALAAPLSATITVSLAPSSPSPQPVGTTITWTPTASDSESGTLDYRYAVSANNGATYQIVQDYDVPFAFKWTPSAHEGTFIILVTVRNTTTLKTASLGIPFQVTAINRASNPGSVVTPTANPLVALFSGPGCKTGSSFRVFFTNGFQSQRTSSIPCTPSLSSNIYVAGMYPSTTYAMNYEVVNGSNVVSGPLVSFTTGAIPANLVFPKVTVPIQGATDTQQGILLLNALPEVPNLNYFPFATDLKGQVLWYYTDVPSTDPNNLRPAPGGTILMFSADPAQLNQGQQIFREFDLAGNTIRSTCVARLSAQLIAKGLQPIISLNHEAMRLPNGHTLLIASAEKLYPEGTQPSPLPGPVDIIGHSILDLDENLQIAWYWNSYDHLDIHRPAVLHETCRAGTQDGCPAIHLAPVANDWVHGNSLYLTTDGSLLFSARHQDFVYKLNYANGKGNGNVIWTLGLGGDFLMTGTTDPYPWFSHQHDAEFNLGGNSLFTVYDNGNTRISQHPGEHSRGQALILDEQQKTASLALNVDLGHYSIALGTAQLLDNGNYHFESGWIVTGISTAYSNADEVTPDGSITYELRAQTSSYRGYRMSTLYSLP